MTQIGVDIDDTLTDFQDTARNLFVDIALERGDKRYQRGAYCAWGEWRSPVDLSDDDVWPHVIDRCHAPAQILSQTPYPGAVETLWELVEQGYRLLFISNRKPEVWGPTHDWLHVHGFPIHQDHGTLCCTLDAKTKYLSTCQFLIDDRPKTLVEFVYDYAWQEKHGNSRKAFGLYMPYNAALTDVPGIKLAPNWKLLRQYLIEQDVLKESVGTTY